MSLIALAGCSGSADEPLVEGAWAKSAESGMTAVFADITNPGSKPLTIVGGSSEAADMVEVHEVVDGVMRQKEGGLTIEPGETHSLMPGADHIMLLGLTDPLEAGETVSVTLELAGGDQLVIDAPVRDYAGANEEYVPGGSEGGMNHGGME